MTRRLFLRLAALFAVAGPRPFPAPVPPPIGPVPPLPVLYEDTVVLDQTRNRAIKLPGKLGRRHRTPETP